MRAAGLDVSSSSTHPGMSFWILRWSLCLQMAAPACKVVGEPLELLSKLLVAEERSCAASATAKLVSRVTWPS